MAKREASKTDDRHYPTRPVVGVGVVIWREEKILLVQRGQAPRAGQWGLPGGVQQLGESVMAAAVREAREETGLEITPLGVITVIDSITRDAKKKIEYHYTIIEVAAESLEGKAKAGDDAKDVRWVKLDEVKKLCKWPEVERVVRMSMVQRVL